MLGFNRELRAQILKEHAPSEIDQILSRDLENRLHYLKYKHSLENNKPIKLQRWNRRKTLMMPEAAQQRYFW